MRVRVSVCMRVCEHAHVLCVVGEEPATLEALRYMKAETFFLCHLLLPVRSKGKGSTSALLLSPFNSTHLSFLCFPSRFCFYLSSLSYPLLSSLHSFPSSLHLPGPPPHSVVRDWCNE